METSPPADATHTQGTNNKYGHTDRRSAEVESPHSAPTPRWRPLNRWTQLSKEGDPGAEEFLNNCWSNSPPNQTKGGWWFSFFTPEASCQGSLMSSGRVPLNSLEQKDLWQLLGAPPCPWLGSNCHRHGRAPGQFAKIVVGQTNWKDRVWGRERFTAGLSQEIKCLMLNRCKLKGFGRRGVIGNTWEKGCRVCEPSLIG